jgi:MFS transporter, DHA2 family, multidrug resistance protein
VDAETIHARRWTILGVLMFSLVIVILDNTILNVALKTIQEDLRATQSDMEWAINSYTLVFAGLMFTFGVLGDRVGRKRLLLIGMVLFGAASALTAFSQGSGWLIANRALMGIGAAMIQPQTLSIIQNVFEPAERGRAIGIWAGVSGAGIALGPVTGGLLLEHFWWGSVFLINVPVALVGALATLWIVPESKDPNPKRVDPFGVVLSIAGLVLLVYGIIKGGEHGNWGSAQVLGAIFGGVAILVLFVWLEWRSRHPSLDVTLFRKPAFSASTAALALTFFAMMGTTFFLTFYWQVVRGYAPLRAGLLVVPVSIGIAFMAPRSAKLVERFGARNVIAAGMVITAAVFVTYTQIEQDTSVWAIELLLLAWGLGGGMVMAPATTVTMSAVPRDKAGVGSAVTNTVRMVGGSLGVAILGSVLSAVYRGRLDGAVNVLPQGLRDSASESIGGTVGAIGQVAGQVENGTLPASAARPLPALAETANNAFLHAMHTAVLVSVGASLVAAVVAWVFLPGRQAPAVHITPATEVPAADVPANVEPIEGTRDADGTRNAAESGVIAG